MKKPTLRLKTTRTIRMIPPCWKFAYNGVTLSKATMLHNKHEFAQKKSTQLHISYKLPNIFIAPMLNQIKVRIRSQPRIPNLNVPQQTPHPPSTTAAPPSPSDIRSICCRSRYLRYYQRTFLPLPPPPSQEPLGGSRIMAARHSLRSARRARAANARVV